MGFLNLDTTIYKAISELSISWLNPVMVFITSLGDGGVFWITIGVLLLFFKRTRKAGIAVLVALVFSSIFCNLLLKQIIDRPRPYVGIESFSPLIRLPRDASFPSGHTSSAFATAGALSYYYRKLSPIFLGLATLIGFSRIYLGVHFPTDVLGGLILGLICAVLSVFLVRSLYPGGNLYLVLSKNKYFPFTKNRE